MNTLTELMKGRNIVIMGDFNSKEICWEEMTVKGGEELWGNILLDMTIGYTLTQWAKVNTKYRNNEEPSKLDLVFPCELDIVDKLEYKLPVGKSVVGSIPRIIICSRQHCMGYQV